MATFHSYVSHYQRVIHQVPLHYRSNHVSAPWPCWGSCLPNDQAGCTDSLIRWIFWEPWTPGPLSFSHLQVLPTCAQFLKPASWVPPESWGASWDTKIYQTVDDPYEMTQPQLLADAPLDFPQNHKTNKHIRNKKNDENVMKLKELAKSTGFHWKYIKPASKAYKITSHQQHSERSA